LLENQTIPDEARIFIDDINKFGENIQRAYQLLILATENAPKGKSPHEIKIYVEDIMRSSIVLAHSSLETALRELIARRLKSRAVTEVPKIPLFGKDKFHWKELHPHRHKTIAQVIDESIDEYMSQVSFNSSGQITSHFKELGVELDYVRPLLSELDAMIQRRHQIVHEADHVRCSVENELENITPHTVLKWLDNANQFVLYSVYSLIISKSYVRELNQKLREENRPEIMITEEFKQKLFNLTPKEELSEFRHNDEISSEATRPAPEVLNAMINPLAVSLPDELFAVVDDFARTCGMSRTELYTSAVREYITNHTSADIINRINASCDKIDTSLPDDIAAVTRKKLLEVEW